MTGFAIQVKDEKEIDRPKFARVYTAFLSNKFKLEYKAFTSWGQNNRYVTCYLFQDEHHFIEIEIDKLPTKLFTPSLIQELDKAIGEICRMDKEYLTTVKEYIDGGGVKWVRM